jgi:hypothetical protein
MDWTALILSVLPTLIVYLLPKIPFLNQIFTTLPNSFFDAIVKIKGGVITWNTPVPLQKSQLEMKKQILLNKIFETSFEDTGEQVEKRERYESSLQEVNKELAALPNIGGIMDFVKNNPMIILIIVGAIIFFTMQKKPTPVPVPTPAPTSIPANP